MTISVTLFLHSPAQRAAFAEFLFKINDSEPVTAGSPAEQTGEPDGAPQDAPSLSSEPSKRRGRRTKAEIAAEEAAANASPPVGQHTPVEVASEAAVTPAQTVAASPVSFDEMKGKLQALYEKTNDLGACVAIVNELGYSKVKDVKPEHFAAVAAKVDQALADAVKS